MRSSRYILVAEEMRAAEQRAIDIGASAGTLMERAGAGAAEAICRFAWPERALVLCGPGNNGGDGYVIARLLKERGCDVRVAALGEPTTDAARHARSLWDSETEALAGAVPAPLLIDALFGTGLTRPLDEAASGALAQLAAAASVRVAVDLPSGVASDDGAILSPVPDYDITVTFGALKPSHLLQPSASRMGRLVIADIGVEVESRLQVVSRPHLPAPGPGDHKYGRGYVAILSGEMPGASALTASAALRAGAGYVRLFAPGPMEGVPHAIVQGPTDPDDLEDARIDAVAVGPGLGRGREGRDLLEHAFASGHPLVLDADALTLLARDGFERLRSAGRMAILTPHEGEFARLFGELQGSKVERARRAAAESGAVVVLKGADTIVAAPDGQAAIALPASAWLASAGTGDVLTGIIVAMRAKGSGAFEAACAGVWLHGRAAARAGAGLIADDLPGELPAVLAECL